MKNEQFLNGAPDEARRAPASSQHQPWPARRRFWHRAFHRPAPAPAKPQAPQPRESREPREEATAAR